MKIKRGGAATAKQMDVGFDSSVEHDDFIDFAQTEVDMNLSFGLFRRTNRVIRTFIHAFDGSLHPRFILSEVEFGLLVGEFVDEDSHKFKGFGSSFCSPYWLATGSKEPDTAVPISALPARKLAVASG